MTHQQPRTDTATDSEEPEAEVIDTREYDAPDAENLTHVAVSFAGDVHILAFIDDGTDTPKLVIDDEGNQPPRQAITTAYRHLSPTCVDVETIEENSTTLSEMAYYYGGGDELHLFDGQSKESMCGDSLMLAGRLRLGGLSEPLSEHDMCPACIRKLKLEGDYGAYERPQRL